MIKVTLTVLIKSRILSKICYTIDDVNHGNGATYNTILII